MTNGPDLETLRASIAGDIVTREDKRWDTVRQAWNLIADQHPAFVAIAETPQDIQEIVRFAAANHLRVAPQSTGHGAATMADLTNTILLRLSRMTTVTVDARARVARIEGGATWREVLAAVTPHGLTALHGGSDTVGVVGFLLTGGLGWLARWKGFACNSVVALDVVSADGTLIHATAGSHPDLFWALPGGGGGQVIVTAVEIELVTLTEVYGGALMWPIEQASAVIHAWAAWTQTIPETVTSNLKLVRYPDIATLPDMFRGRSLVAVTVVHVGSPDAGADVIAPLRSIGEPYLDDVRVMPAAELAHIAADPTDPLPIRADGVLLTTLDEATMNAIVQFAGPTADLPLIFVELRHLGGALAASAADNGALANVTEPYMLYALGVAITPQLDDVVKTALDELLNTLAPWTSGRTLMGFAERQPSINRSLPTATGKRLAAIHADVDPRGMITANRTNDATACTPEHPARG
jgi:FAD/FMN-containing dehydrogenase